jgi:hypothetical protein
MRLLIFCHLDIWFFRNEPRAAPVSRNFSGSRPFRNSEVHNREY